MKKKRFVTIEGTHSAPNRRSVEFEMNYSQLYDGFWTELAKVQMISAHLFFFWAAEQANTRGEFAFNKIIFDQFNEDLKSKNMQPYKMNTISLALKKLVEANFLVRTAKGYYQINPHILWRGPVKERTSTLHTFEQNQPTQEESAVPVANVPRRQEIVDSPQLVEPISNKEQKNNDGPNELFQQQEDENIWDT